MATKSAEELMQEATQGPKSRTQSQKATQQPTSDFDGALSRRDRISEDQIEEMRIQASAARRQQAMTVIAVNLSDEELEENLANAIKWRLVSGEMDHSAFGRFIAQAVNSDRLLPETIEVLASIRSTDLKLSLQQNALLSIFQGIMQNYRTNMVPTPMPALAGYENTPLLSAH